MSKIEAFWVNATAGDVARVMAEETVEARFWDNNLQGWTTRTLSGWQTTGVRSLWHSHDGFVWARCQVYREPSWYANKPDPGPGWRLLEKFPDEPVAVGDEFFKSGQWHKTCRPAGDSQDRTGWYRRRIEPVKPKTARLDEGSKCPVQGCFGALEVRSVRDCSCHIRPPCAHCADNPPCCPVCEWTSGDPTEPVEPGPKHYVLRVGDTVENPNGDRIKVVNPGFEQSHYALKFGDTISTPNGQTITITEKGFEVTQ